MTMSQQPLKRDVYQFTDFEEFSQQQQHYKFETIQTNILVVNILVVTYYDLLFYNLKITGNVRRFTVE